MFGVLVVGALVTGFGHATGLVRTVGPFTAMQVHVAAALGSIGFAIAHVVARPVKPRWTDLSRRALLRGSLVGGGSLAAFGVLSGVLHVARLPGRATRFTGSYPSGPGDFPITQWLADAVPALDPEAWTLTVVRHGREVERRSLADLQATAEPVRATLDCTGGWYADPAWMGVRLDRLLDPENARSVRAVSATGYSRRYPAGDLSNLWLAVGVDGVPLSAGHGAPARVVAPGRRGFWWVKWVTVLEVSDTPWWWQPPFPAQ